jgi:hypothetical protein
MNERCISPRLGVLYRKWESDPDSPLVAFAVGTRNKKHHPTKATKGA